MSLLEYTEIMAQRGGLPKSDSQTQFSLRVAHKLVTCKKLSILAPMLETRAYRAEQAALLFKMSIDMLHKDRAWLIMDDFADNADLGALKDVVQPQDVRELEQTLAFNCLLQHGDIGKDTFFGNVVYGMTMGTLRSLDFLISTGEYAPRPTLQHWEKDAIRQLWAPR